MDVPGTLLSVKQERASSSFAPDNVQCIDGLTCPCLPAQTYEPCEDCGVVMRMVHVPIVARRPRAMGGHP